MRAVGGLVSELLARASGLRALELVAELARLHRIQGTEEIVVAAELVKQRLDELGVESELEVFQGPLGLHEVYTFWEPRGWAHEGGVEVYVREGGSWKLVSSSKHQPIRAVAHTPPGEVEGTARLVADPEHQPVPEIPILKSIDDYWKVVKRGASAAVVTHDGPGVRYYALFPPNFTEVKLVPAASLEKGEAERLHGKTVKVVSRTRYALTKTPVLRAWVGEGPARVLLVAHVCHPSPGAHDNASGVAAVVEALALLKERERELREAGLRVEALVVPEYTGTAAAFRMGVLDPSQLLAAVSVDMVGANLLETGGSTLLISSPYAVPSPLDLPLFKCLYQALSAGSSFGESFRYPQHGLYRVGYEFGSDHDVALAHGVPASMVNEWPDKYYHTSLDTPDKLDPARLAAVSAALASAVLALARELRSLADLVREWASALKTLSALTLDLDAERAEKLSELVDRGADHVLHRCSSLLGRELKGRPWGTDVELERRGTLGTRWLELVGGEEGRRLAGLERKLRTIYCGVLPTLVSATGSLEAAKLELEAVYGVRPEDELVRLVLRMLGAKP